MAGESRAEPTGVVKHHILTPGDNYRPVSVESALHDNSPLSAFVFLSFYIHFVDIAGTLGAVSISGVGPIFDFTNSEIPGNHFGLTTLTHTAFISF